MDAVYLNRAQELDNLYKILPSRQQSRNEPLKNSPGISGGFFILARSSCKLRTIRRTDHNN